MESPTAITVTAFIAYLVGSIPTAVMVAKAKGVDIYKVGSGNPGASNVSRALGKKWAVFVFVVDAAKGAVPVAVSRFVLGQPWLAATAMGLAAVIGHSWPVTVRFKGGKGVATGAGVLLVSYPLIALGASVLWAVIAKATKKASVASLTALVVCLAGVVLLGRSAGEKIVVAAMAAVVVWRHLPNIERLLAGKELALGSTALDEGDGDDGPTQKVQ